MSYDKLYRSCLSYNIYNGNSSNMVLISKIIIQFKFFSYDFTGNLKNIIEDTDKCEDDKKTLTSPLLTKEELSDFV